MNKYNFNDCGRLIVSFSVLLGLYIFSYYLVQVFTPIPNNALLEMLILFFIPIIIPALSSFILPLPFNVAKEQFACFVLFWFIIVLLSFILVIGIDQYELQKYNLLDYSPAVNYFLWLLMSIINFIAVSALSGIVYYIKYLIEKSK